MRNNEVHLYIILDHYINGVKQCCILSPTLFSLVMSDLADMKYGHILGIPFGKGKIPCLLYADDVCLLGDNEENLQKILSVSHAFASKWNMSLTMISLKQW